MSFCLVVRCMHDAQIGTKWTVNNSHNDSVSLIKWQTLTLWIENCSNYIKNDKCSRKKNDCDKLSTFCLQTLVLFEIFVSRCVAPYDCFYRTPNKCHLCGSASYANSSLSHSLSFLSLNHSAMMLMMAIKLLLLLSLPIWQREILIESRWICFNPWAMKKWFQAHQSPIHTDQNVARVNFLTITIIFWYTIDNALSNSIPYSIPYHPNSNPLHSNEWRWK